VNENGGAEKIGPKLIRRPKDEPLLPFIPPKVRFFHEKSLFS
jgi:hypothetical protein